ncbi:MAG: hypothetical protein QOE05_2395 [Actinomycetota bacterium]|nr:hypothetical protein [Actinomycetota bacterium]
MPSFRTARVSEITSARRGLQRLLLDDGSRAYVLTQLTGDVEVGDDVIVNTTAVELGLGTGGWHVVHWNLSRSELDAPGPGHIMKIRYTSLQVDTGSAEESLGPPADSLPQLGGVPVLGGSLHSQVAVAAAVIKTIRPGLRISYVMTDGGALPLALSDLVAELAQRSLIDGTITAGHAFGGDLEAVSVPAALQLAVEMQRADVVICAMGPGVVGTSSHLGTTAVEVSAVLTWAERLGCRPVPIARASSGDPRPRHQGISHHTRTALALTPGAVDVPLPRGAGLAGAIEPPHAAVEIEVPDVAAILEALSLRVTTMGRGVAEDRLFFDVTAAAAAHAVNLLRDGGTVAAS